MKFSQGLVILKIINVRDNIMKSKTKMLERNGKRWSYCHGNPAICLLHYHGSFDNKMDFSIVDDSETHYFNQDINHIDYENHALNFMNVLSKDELIAVAHYADSGYKPINKSLIYENDIKYEYVDAIDSSINKANMGLKTVYRGARRTPEVSLGGTLKFKEYLSTSLNPQKAYEFTLKETPIILMFNTNKGAPISMVHKELEVILPRNSEFRLVDIIDTNFTCVYPDTDYTISLGETKIYSFIDA